MTTTNTESFWMTESKSWSNRIHLAVVRVYFFFLLSKVLAKFATLLNKQKNTIRATRMVKDAPAWATKFGFSSQRSSHQLLSRERPCDSLPNPWEQEQKTNTANKCNQNLECNIHNPHQIKAYSTRSSVDTQACEGLKKPWVPSSSWPHHHSSLGRSKIVISWP